MDWIKRWVGIVFARIRQAASPHEAPLLNRHELRDIGLEGWRQDREPLRDDRGERITRP